MKFRKRLCGYVSEPEYLDFKKRAGKKFNYERGFTDKAMREAIYLWSLYQDIPKDFRMDMLRVAKEKHPDRHELLALQDLIVQVMYDYIRKE